MVLRNRLSDKRFRPIGWRGESYRHYLASKGIPTNRYTAKKYFSRDFMKGNRDDEIEKQVYVTISDKTGRPTTVPLSTARKSLNAQGYNAELQEKLFGIPKPPRRSKSRLDVADRDEISAIIGQSRFVDPFEQLVPTEQQSVGVESVPQYQQQTLPSEVVARATAPVTSNASVASAIEVAPAPELSSEQRNVTSGAMPDPTVEVNL